MNLNPNPATITPDDVASLCERAADEVLLRGHGKGTAMDDDGRVCMIGALGCAAGIGVIPLPKGAYSSDEARADLRWSWSEILGTSAICTKAHGALVELGYGYTWNDRAATTEGDVHDAFLATAKAIRNGEIEVCP